MLLTWKIIYLAASCFFCAAFLDVKAAEDSLTLSRPLVLKWLLEQGDPMPAPPGFYSESVYVQTSEGVVASISLTGGKLKWRSDIGGLISTSPVADGRAVYVASESISSKAPKPQGAIVALSKTSGITIWSQALTSPIQGPLLLLDNAICGATKDGRLFAYNSETGDLIWSTQYPSPFSEKILLGNRRLIMNTPDGLIISVDGRTGRLIWRYQTQNCVRCVIAVSGSNVFVGSANGYLTALEETATGVILKWRRRVGTSVIGLTHSSKGVVVVSGDNFVQLLSDRRGSRLWKRRMPGRVFAQTIIDSRNALLATLGGDACIVLSLESGKQVNVITVGDGNYILATPVLTPVALIIPTHRGLMAFGQPDAN